jgi:REP element-mobilizing transposase RayT
MEPHSCNLRKHRQEHGVFFVTKCLQPKLGVIKEDVAEAICSALCFSACQQQILSAAFVVMPDHWHALLGCQDEKGISQRMAALDRWISRQTSSRLRQFGVVWQDNFYETRIRSARQFQYIRGYIEENPVRAGLASSVSDWPWSSAIPRFQETLSIPWPWPFAK